MSEKKQRKVRKTRARELMDSASFTGCTGLMPVKPLDDHQWDAYEDIVSMATSGSVESGSIPDDV